MIKEFLRRLFTNNKRPIVYFRDDERCSCKLCEKPRRTTSSGTGLYYSWIRTRHRRVAGVMKDFGIVEYDAMEVVRKCEGA